MAKLSNVVREKSLRTREKILEAAERIFADKGFVVASMRDIMSAAGVNLSCAYYYFESKEALTYAVIERHILPIMEKERQGLSEAREQAGAQAIPAKVLIETMVHARAAGINDTVRRLFLQLFLHDGALQKAVFDSLDELTREIREEFFREFSRTFPHLSPQELNFRLLSIEALMRGWKTLEPALRQSNLPNSLSKEEHYQMFVEQILQIFSAPATLFTEKFN